MFAHFSSGEVQLDQLKGKTHMRIRLSAKFRKYDDPLICVYVQIDGRTDNPGDKTCILDGKKIFISQQALLICFIGIHIGPAFENHK